MLNIILNEDKRLTEMLDYLVLAKDFEKYVPQGSETLAEISKLRNEVRSLYKKARLLESQGDSDEAIDGFDEAFTQARKLSGDIKKFTDNKTYLLAVAREEHDRKEKKRDRRNAIWAGVVAAVISSLLTVLGTVVIPRMFP
jgi:tetratricopeptide (TPR) repeat protein